MAGGRCSGVAVHDLMTEQRSFSRQIGAGYGGKDGRFLLFSNMVSGLAGLDGSNGGPLLRLLAYRAARHRADGSGDDRGAARRAAPPRAVLRSSRRRAAAARAPCRTEP